MQDILKLIQARRSMRVPFDAERQVARQDLRQILGSRALGAYCA